MILINHSLFILIQYLYAMNNRKYLAELIGTFALVFCGTGSIIVNTQTNGSLGLIGIAAAFGLIITAIIYIFGRISGAHINPAVSIALAVGKLITKKVALMYILFQVLGAFLASGVVVLLFPEATSLGETLPSGSFAQSFWMEIITTFLMMLTILGVTSHEEKEITALSGVIIGGTVIGLIMIAGPISGGSFNPARSIAPAIVSGHLQGLWIYLLAPILGAVLAMFSWQFLNKTDEN